MQLTQQIVVIDEPNYRILEAQAIAGKFSVIPSDDGEIPEALFHAVGK